MESEFELDAARLEKLHDRCYEVRQKSRRIRANSRELLAVGKTLRVQLGGEVPLHRYEIAWLRGK